jgi:hypothetical protein
MHGAGPNTSAATHNIVLRQSDLSGACCVFTAKSSLGKSGKRQRSNKRIKKLQKSSDAVLRSSLFVGVLVPLQPYSWRQNPARSSGGANVTHHERSGDRHNGICDARDLRGGEPDRAGGGAISAVLGCANYDADGFRPLNTSRSRLKLVA